MQEHQLKSGYKRKKERTFTKSHMVICRVYTVYMASFLLAIVIIYGQSRVGCLEDAYGVNLLKMEATDSTAVSYVNAWL